MSLDQPNVNKMMNSAPDKKEFHFASDGVHYAEMVWAKTTQEAESIYHQIKRKIVGDPILTTGNAATAPAATSATTSQPQLKEEITSTNT